METAKPGPGQLFLDMSRQLLTADYLKKIESCLTQLTDDDVWERPNEASNSIGNLLLHLRGNVTEWILGGVGRMPHERRRQAEFAERAHVPAPELLARLQEAVARADAVIAAVEPGMLVATRHIQGYDVTVLEAIYHVVEHFGMHTGQIILMTKSRTGRDLQLWVPPES